MSIVFYVGNASSCIVYNCIIDTKRRLTNRHLHKHRITALEFAGQHTTNVVVESEVSGEVQPIEFVQPRLAECHRDQVLADHLQKTRQHVFRSKTICVRQDAANHVRGRKRVTRALSTAYLLTPLSITKYWCVLFLNIIFTLVASTASIW